MRKIKSELGAEAIIISTKKVRQKGVFGFVKKPLIEIMAAMDNESISKKEAGRTPKRDIPFRQSTPMVPNEVFEQFQKHLKATQQSQQTKPVRQYIKEVEPQQNMNLESFKETSRSVIPPQNIHILPARNQSSNENHRAEITENSDRMGGLETKVVQIEALLKKMYNEVSSTSKMVAEHENSEKLVPLTKVLQLFYSNLIKNEVEPEYSWKIIEKVSDSLNNEDNVNDATTVLYNEVFSTLGKPETITIRADKKPTVVVFVGPTGVGKTTTLAKIAANYSLNENLKVGLITADTYRIAAVQQLKTYAEILGIPVSVVYEQNEINKAIDAYADKDLVLIDTAGRSHRNRAHFEELKTMIEVTNADDVFLVLSSTTSIKNNREIINNYSFLDKYKLIFTKADESQSLGMILNARIMTGRNLSYVTIGQSVPDDIEVASIDKIARNLIGSIVE